MQDILCSPLGLDSARPTLVLSDVRAQPSKKDDGYATLETEGDLPDATAIIQTFHLFHTGPARNRPLFAMTQHFTELGDTPFWHLRAPKGAEMTSFREVCLSHPYLQAFVVCYDRHLLHHQLICLWTCKCNQLNGLCHKKGFFHGMKQSNH